MGHTIATIFLPRSYCHTYSGYPMVGFWLSAGRCTLASSTRHRRFPGAKGARLHFSNTVAAEFTGSEPSRLWSVLRQKVYRSIMGNVSELDMRLINEMGCFVQSFVDAAIGQLRRRLSACVRGAGHTLSTKHKVSAILSCIYKMLLNWWKYDKVLT